MSPEIKKEVQFEIGHVLFIDIVGYSKLLITEQSEQLQKLKEIVRGTEQFRRAEAEGKLLRLPTGDGGALVFRTSAEAPVLCAMEIAKVLKDCPKLGVRMGIHSGPVNEISDLNEQANIAGAGINIAQRVMDCGDAGHILLSKHVAEDLEQYPRWQPLLHDLGECEVKHGARAHVFNLYTEELGNPQVPEKLRQAKEKEQTASLALAAAAKPARRSGAWIAAVVIAAAAVAAAGFYIFSNLLRPIPEKSVAVLPFDNLSEEKANAYFADGIQDEILTKLAGIGDLKVISRSSTAKYKSKPEDLRTVANQLGVATVLEGSVQKATDKVRVNVQLVDARNDTHLWAKSYDRDLRDIFAVESEVAQEIADTLRAKLSPRQSTALAAAPTRDTEAYDLFLKGEYQERQAESAENPGLFNRAETFYRQALARDPNFALAYARLAYGRMQQHWFSHRLNSAQLEEVKSNIERAMAIAPELPEAYLALGVYHYWGHLDYDSALKAFDRAIELQPGNSDSRTFRAAIYRRRGEWRRSLAESERALELNPRDSFTHTDIGDTYLMLRRWSEAERALTRALALDPHSINAGFHLAQTYVNSAGDISRARQAWEGIPDYKTGFSPYGIVISQMISETAYLDVMERRFTDALKVWDTVPMDTPDARLRQLDARVGIQMLAAQSGTAKSDAEQARPLLEARLAEQVPGDHTALTESAWVYVCLGRNDDALRIAREATEALPIERDAIVGAYFLTGLAQIDAHVGRPDEAVKILRQLLSIPAGEYVSLRRLKIDPVWDPIRNNAEFQKVLSEPEPETIYK